VAFSNDKDIWRNWMPAHELVSDGLIEQICRAARQAAFFGDVRIKDRGLRLEAVDEVNGGFRKRACRGSNKRRSAHFTSRRCGST
jgi:hypothetical protein